MIVRESYTEGTSSSAAIATVTVPTWAVNDTAVINVRWYGTQTLSSVDMDGETDPSGGCPVATTPTQKTPEMVPPAPVLHLR
jgi:hypothetical protein